MEFLSYALEPVNLPYTFLMILVSFYWLGTFVGVLDLSSFDVDVDLDADIDMDADVDTDADVSAEGGSAVNNLLYFFNIGEIPIMILISFFALFLWVGSVLSNYYLANSSWGVAAILFIPLIIVSLLLTKVACMPFVQMFKHINKPDDVKVVGKVCTLRSTADGENMGLAEVKLDGIAQTVYVVTHDGTPLNKGDQALVLMRKEDKNCYVVEAYHTSN
ncbi:OB-fold-containig protein [Chondrinema litorale]|uniref:OB-fold-containig protein n=1 Tax=Chondrinema litorale TaxID=2994555 RepID=UPI002543E047|nr:OB-fold-containig protein [Chondrinema litorale]UZR95280.1 DUF1449 family protein [Chondrinema litorale]